MKKLVPVFIYVLFPFFAFSQVNWESNFEAAKQSASAQHKYILLNFSGSDWCGPCIRMHNEIFNSDVFSKLAAEKLILVNADFPRQKKNQLPKEQQRQNDMLADRYNSNGSFPLTVLLSADGKMIKLWDGCPSQGADIFTAEIRAIVFGSN